MSGAPTSPSIEHSTNHFIPPQDWPTDGPIDLALHDLPHGSSSIEWWYVNSHIKTAEKEFSLFASFFRKLLTYDKKKKKPVYAHSITWAITDVTDKEYYAVSLVDKLAPKLGLKKLRAGELVKDERIRKAAIEMVKKGNVPYPDRLFKNDIFVGTSMLHLNFDGNELKKLDDGSYQLHLYDEEQKVGADLNLVPKKPVTRHGDNGIVRGVGGEDMFYYFIPKCEVKGSVTLEDKKNEITEASGWYDHEFGQSRDEKDDDAVKDIAWNWLAVQLDNGCELSVANLFNTKRNYRGCGHWAIYIDEKGKRHTFDEFKLKPLNSWTSMRTFNDYPTKWSLEIPGLDLKLKLDTPHEQQEFITIISKPAFWEGRMNVKGTLAGKPVTGPAYIERSGFEHRETMDDFLKAVGKATLKSIKKILPLNPNKERAAELITRKENTHYLNGFDIPQYTNAVIRPIRDIIDRGGKSWRSYAALACCDIVGGNSQPVADGLALPEMLHVGSLIVDDVQDKSEKRRGGPACHKTYGEALAINAGCSCYFIGQIAVMHQDKITDAQKLKIYGQYFEALRAAHAGQALDLSGLHYMMPHVVESGNGKLLEKKVLAIHRLKTAAPAGYMAQVGATLGGGNEAQTAALGEYYETLGVAFQIVDDVLNLRGFEDDMKSKGEDIAEGKVTFPVAKAMSSLDYENRKELWNILKTNPQDRKEIGKVIDIIESCGALDACDRQARLIINKAWRKLDPLVRDSYVKMMLRAFSWYILDRKF